MFTDNTMRIKAYVKIKASRHRSEIKHFVVFSIQCFDCESSSIDNKFCKESQKRKSSTYIFFL